MWCSRRMQKTLSTAFAGRSMAKAEVCIMRTRLTSSGGWNSLATRNISSELSAPMMTRLGFSASNDQKRPAPQGRSSTRPGSSAKAKARRASCWSRQLERRRERPD
ncbi:hypothetical protein D3C80_1924740 [compost metagenome]